MNHQAPALKHPHFTAQDVAASTGDTIRVLLLADTHLGFDLPFRPRVERRRRGHDFFVNFHKTLQPAFDGDVDFVVHGGDLFYRSKVPEALVDMAMTPLLEVADRGTPVYIIPGNHERSSIPLHLWTAHKNLHIFDRPRTFIWVGRNGRLALSGFPFTRKIRVRFAELVAQTGYRENPEIPHLLCMHQVVEGAQVGVQNYTFRNGPDVVAGQDIPPGFVAVLSGHIHRAQILSHDLRYQSLAAPVIYPGSVERTSFAERLEEKGYVILSLKLTDSHSSCDLKAAFIPLPARPMVSLRIDPKTSDIEVLGYHLSSELKKLEPDSVVRVDFIGAKAEEARSKVTAAYLRQLAPSSMNISLAPEWRK
jgi:exonuclease SbcD